MCGRPITQAYGSPGLMRYATGVCSQCLRATAADRRLGVISVYDRT